MEDDELITGGTFSLSARVIDGTLGVFRVDGDDGDVVGVVVFVGAFTFEGLHVGALLSLFVRDDGIGLTHRDPGQKEVLAIAVDIGGVAGAVGEVDATTKEALVGACDGSPCVLPKKR